MKGNNLTEFLDDLLLAGGPEKEFTFRDKYYFLETMYREAGKTLELYVDEYDNSNPREKVYIRRYSFTGNTLAECVKQFQDAPIFDGLTLFKAERDISVLFG